MPAAAVIPAPIAYIKVVAVKKLVVEILQLCIVPSLTCNSSHGCIFSQLVFTSCESFTLSKLECFKQVLPEYCSME